MNITALQRLGTGLALAAGLYGCGGSSALVDPTLRATAYGQVQGNDDSAATGTYSWKGIPFAKPPVGTLRWKAPVDPAAWSGTLTTRSFGNACIQYGRIYGPGANNKYDATIGTTLNTAVGSEDCLTLNIWRPASTDASLPVIYFIYGGSDVSGYSADPVYDGAALARSANAVVVTANYRVGLFGWLNLPQLKTGSNANDDSGNFGTLDTIKTLQFINKNIANFGGDPGNVTVMGQSAGAINVYALMTSPQVVSASPKLFHKAVAISGGISLASELPAGSIATLSPASTYLAQGNALLYNLLIADGKATDTASAQAYAATQTDDQIASYLRGKDGSTIFTVLLTKLAAAGLSGSGPIPEGTVVPVDPVANISAGNYLKVPLLASNTRDEAKLFASFLALSPALGGVPGLIVSDASRYATMFTFNPDAPTTLTDADFINPQYLPVATPGTGYNAKTDLLNSIFFLPSRDNVLSAVKSQQSGVWYYQFNWDKEPAPWNDVYGAAHAFDLPFLFGNFGPSLFGNVIGGTANKGGRLALSNAMMKSLAAFARNGDPNDPALGVTWPTWPKKLVFDATLTDKAISVP
ncbi:carboxylesterase family protein [Polaromonas sp. C04]|uniref:carboxylesterase/lipase family protein n=1 Tax=Polaromonas sp. C04 TaxID=1945857 RepID=UPI000987B8AD|nr:carboxylesterase family protein [Polaromonas sp. C04]OOG49887.1 carboxylesterase [Polaromonas sp. C04]